MPMIFNELSYSNKTHPSRVSPPRSPRHTAQPVMPIGFVVVTWRRCGANARTYGLETLEPPSRQNAGSGAISTMDRCTGGLRSVLAFCGHGGASDASDCQDTPHPSRVSLEADQLDRMATRHVERVVVVGANARTYEQRMDRRMRRTKIRQGDALEVPSERRITIRTTTALTNTSLKGFCICSSCRRCGCRYKVTNRTARALALGLNACGSPSSLGRGALPVFGRHPD